MKLTLNFRSALTPLTLDLPGSEDEILAHVKAAIENNEILDLTDTRGERVLVPARSIGYAVVPSPQTTPVGFGRM